MGLLSQTLLVCLDYFLSENGIIRPFIEKAHHRFRKEVAEGEGLQRVRIGDLHLL
jgi:hypothetical protein